jgi:pimeloyl-ACP methyl ester carboxylesterase
MPAMSALLRLVGVVIIACAATPGRADAPLDPPGTHAVSTLAVENWITVEGVAVDVKAFWPTGLVHAAGAPLVIYSPGGGTGLGGTLPAVVQHEALWRRLASMGATVLYLQNEAESSPTASMFALRPRVVVAVLDALPQVDAEFGTAIGPAPRVLVAGWSLGAATMAQLGGADFEAGVAPDSRVRALVLFASPAVGAYGGRITADGMRRLRVPSLLIFGTNDMGQPGTFNPAQPPETSPRGVAALAAAEGPSRMVVTAVLTGLNHFQYGSSAPPPGSPLEATVAWIDDRVADFASAVLAEPGGCGPYADGDWIDPARLTWANFRCTAEVGFADGFEPVSD